MKIVTITLTIEADKLPLDEFSRFLELVSKDMDAIEEKVKNKFPDYEVKGTSMKVEDER